MSVLSWHGPLSGVSRNSISTLSHRSEVTETCPGRENQRILGMRRFPLFSPLKQGTVDGMIGAQLLHQVFNILDHQVHLWRGLDQCSHAALLPLMAQGQHYTTFRILVVVLGQENQELRCSLFLITPCMSTFWGLILLDLRPHRLALPTDGVASWSRVRWVSR